MDMGLPPPPPPPPILQDLAPVPVTEPGTGSGRVQI